MGGLGTRCPMIASFRCCGPSGCRNKPPPSSGLVWGSDVHSICINLALKPLGHCGPRTLMHRYSRVDTQSRMPIWAHSDLFTVVVADCFSFVLFCIACMFLSPTQTRPPRVSWFRTTSRNHATGRFYVGPHGFSSPLPRA